MNTQQSFDRYLTYLNAVGRSQATVKAYQSKCRDFVSLYSDQAVDTITPDDIDDYFVALRGRSGRWQDHPCKPAVDGGLSHSTIYSIMRHVRSFLNFCATRGYCSISPAAHLRIKKKRKSNYKAHDPVAVEKLQKALLSGDSRGCKRDAALLRLFLDTGGRAGELCAAVRDTLDTDRCRVYFDNGKTGDGWLYFSPDSLQIVRDWLAVAPASEWLFCSVWLTTGEQIDSNTVWQIFDRRKKQFGITGRINPHSHRHAVGQAWAQEHGLRLAQAKLRHVDINSTMVYASPDDEMIQKLTAKTSLVPTTT